MEAQRYPINVRLIGVMHKEKKNKVRIARAFYFFSSDDGRTMFIYFFQSKMNGYLLNEWYKDCLALMTFLIFHL